MSQGTSSGQGGPAAGRGQGSHRGASGPPRSVARARTDPARLVAWRTVRAVSERDAYANLVLPSALTEAGLSGRDAAFATELCYGVLRGQGRYDAILTRCVDRPLADLDAPLLDALRVGCHQALAMRVPAHAAVAATVDLVRGEIGAGASSLANAVLRRVVARDLGAWLTEVAPDQGQNPDGYLSVVTSHPVWIVRALRDALGFAGRPTAELPDLLAADNEAAPVSLVALPGLCEPDELLGRGATPGRLSARAVRVTGAVSAMEAVRQARARVQDEGSQLVTTAFTLADTVGPDAGRWLDLCAGPGGKAALLGATLAQRQALGLVPSDARLVACEPVPHRVRLVHSSLSGVLRRAPDLVDVRCADGRELCVQEPDHYDRVLVDAPCTGLGALRRRPEARWRRRPGDLAELSPLQRSLLVSALTAVRPGGVVAYVTCSPHPVETRTAVQDALRGRDDVTWLDAVPLVARATQDRVDDLGPSPDVQLWPHRHGTDAMYLALLRRER